LDSIFYENDRERWREIDKVRKKVAKRLQIPQGTRVLDVLVGPADFSRTIAQIYNVEVTAVEITDEDIEEAKRRIRKEALLERVALAKMDITCMGFPNDTFDYVVNFIGWEDFTAVSGEELIDKAFGEIVRVLKVNGILAVTFIPAFEPRDDISRKDEKLREHMYKSSKRPKYFRQKFFLQTFEKHRIKLLGKNVFETPKSRLLPQDAKRYIKWLYNNYKSFYAPDVEMRSYEGILRRFQPFIEKHGIREKKSKFVFLMGKKSKL